MSDTKTLDFLTEFKRYVGRPRHNYYTSEPKRVTAYGPMDCCGAIFMDGNPGVYPKQNKGFAFSLQDVIPKFDLNKASSSILSRTAFLADQYNLGRLVEHQEVVDLEFVKVYYNYWKADEDVHYDD